MNIEEEKIIEQKDNSEDDYRCYIQKIMILQVIQQVFCEMLIGGRNVLTVIFFSESLILGQLFKMIFQSLKGYFTKWCQRNHL